MDLIQSMDLMDPMVWLLAASSFLICFLVRRLVDSFRASHRWQVCAGHGEQRACCRPVSQHAFPFWDYLSPTCHMRVDINNNTESTVHFHCPSVSCCLVHPCPRLEPAKALEDMLVKPENSVSPDPGVGTPDECKVSRFPDHHLSPSLNIHPIGRRATCTRRRISCFGNALRSWRKLSTAFRPKCACLSIASTDLKRGWSVLPPTQVGLLLPFPVLSRSRQSWSLSLRYNAYCSMLFSFDTDLITSSPLLMMRP